MSRDRVIPTSEGWQIKVGGILIGATWPMEEYARAAIPVERRRQQKRRAAAPTAPPSVTETGGTP